MNWFRNIFSGNKDQTSELPVYSPRPADWCKTFADLYREMDEGKRKSIKQSEIDWARDYERSLIPKGSRFPQKGDVYQVEKDLEVTYMTSWAAPFTGGGKTMIYKGERFWVDSDPMDDEPIGAYVLAIDYEELEQRIVDAAERSNPKYGGFYFQFDTISLNTDFALVKVDYTNKGHESDAY